MSRIFLYRDSHKSSLYAWYILGKEKYNVMENGNFRYRVAEIILALTMNLIYFSSVILILYHGEIFLTLGGKLSPFAVDLSGIHTWGQNLLSHRRRFGETDKLEAWSS